MIAVLLGTAAGGGIPQWNCACTTCAGCRAGTTGVAARTQDCVAISADGHGWYLLNASPDLRVQLSTCARLAPGPAPRQTPLRGALLTDAELDHTIGLLTLREAADFTVWAPPTVLHALARAFPVPDIVSGYNPWTWQPLGREAFWLGEDPGLRCSALRLTHKVPKYAARAASPTGDDHWAVAYRIEDPATGRALVYAPTLREWTPAFDRFLNGANCLVLDGTFYTANEMSATVAGGEQAVDTQRAMGHLPITGPDGTLAHLRDHPNLRCVYTHINNTNPVLDAESHARATVEASGAEILPDGAELVI
jgi:pyrroloquinoline quinone biosynthesis protein B